MIKRLVFNEWLQWRRDSRLKWLIFFLLFLSLLALVHQLHYQYDLWQTRMSAQEKSRTAWLSQELKHPHIAAHFGNYAYKKPYALHCFDPGLTIYTGTSIYLEPHRQNDFLFNKTQESDTGIRFGWISPALICQFIIPLLIALLSFNSINGERQRGTLALLLSQEVAMRHILWSKFLAVFLIFEIFLISYLSLTALCSWFLFGNLSLAATFYLWLIYSLYYIFWSLLGVIISAQIKDVGTSISALLLIWMLALIILPRVAANIAENTYPVSTNYEFRKEIAQAIEKGLDGHNPSGDRAKKIEKDLLVKYKVDSVQQLPFNFEGYIMQQGEEYSSKVYDHYFERIFSTLKKQKDLQGWFSIVSPFIAVRTLSMTGTSATLETEIDFQQHAEKYRRDFVQTMNVDMMENSKYGEFETYKVKSGIYDTIKDLHIDSHPLGWSLQYAIKENIWLVLWVAALSLVLVHIGNKNLFS